MLFLQWLSWTILFRSCTSYNDTTWYWSMHGIVYLIESNLNFSYLYIRKQWFIYQQKVVFLWAKVLHVIIYQNRHKMCMSTVVIIIFGIVTMLFFHQCFFDFISTNNSIKSDYWSYNQTIVSNLVGLVLVYP